MNYDELQSAIELHQKAFAFLQHARATGSATSQPFDEATVQAWQHPHTCVEWVRRHYDELPATFRPERSTIDAFGQLLASFFATSFAVSKVCREGQWRLQIRALPTRRLDNSKKSKRALGKEKHAAETLRAMTLRTLAEEIGGSLDDSEFSTLSADPSIAGDLTLWTYARQLVNRSQFASQGPAVYHLWLDLSEKTRRQFSADLVWQSRSRLIQFLHQTPQLPS